MCLNKSESDDDKEYLEGHHPEYLSKKWLGINKNSSDESDNELIDSNHN